MRGDIVCIPENIEREGYNFGELMNIREEEFPLYALQITEDMSFGNFMVVNPRSKTVFGWSMPEDAEDYMYVIEEVP